MSRDTKIKITHKIFDAPWMNIKPFFKKGYYFEIDQSVSLMKVALDMKLDNVDGLQLTLKDSHISPIDEKALGVLENNKEKIYRCVIVRPYVLIQRKDVREDDVIESSLDNILSLR